MDAGLHHDRLTRLGDLTHRGVPGHHRDRVGLDARPLAHPLVVADLVGQDERHDGAGVAGTGGAAGAVQVVLVVRRRVVVHDQVDIVHVDPAGGDIGGDQHPGVTGAEVVQRLLAGALGQVAVDRGSLDAHHAQLRGKAVGAVLGAYEEQCASRPGSNLRGDVGLGRVADGEHLVVHVVDRRLRRGDGVHGRRLEVGPHQPVDPAVQGGGEQHPLAAGRGQLEQRGDRRQEAQVSHVVGLVEHGHLDLRQVALALVDEVLQATGGGDHDVDAAPQLVDLAAHRRAAVDGAELEVQRLGQRRECVVDLLRELAGRHQDQRARLVCRPPTTDEAGQHRQPEGQRLAGAGLAAAEHVPAGEGVGQRPYLDGERGLQAAARQRRDEHVGQAELAKGRDDLGRFDGGGGVESDLELILHRDVRGGRGRAARRRAARGTPGGRAGLPGGRHRKTPSESGVAT